LRGDLDGGILLSGDLDGSFVPQTRGSHTPIWNFGKRWGIEEEKWSNKLLGILDLYKETK
jgi:hypothetical protein